jgi:membrane protease YdiL (CAAX protease family)
MLPLHVPTSRKSSIIEIVAGVSAIIAICLLSKKWFEKGPSGLGVEPGNMIRGIGLGLLSFAAIAPVLYTAILITDIASKLITHKLPPVHPALKAMAVDHSAVSLGLLVIMVVIVAPISEELFFRGLIQSWLAQRFAGMGSHNSTTIGNLADRPSPPAGVPGTLESNVNENPYAVPDASASAPEISAPPRAWPNSPWLPVNRWMAILITAGVFAAVHYAVTPGYDDYFPVLFILAVALGYMYERTGNIWTDITMHACFNLIPTILILCGVKPK